MVQVDPIVDELYDPYQYEERQELIEAAVKREVERRQNEVDSSTDGNQ